MEASNFKGDWLALTYRDRSVDVPLAESFISEWGMAGRPKFKLETFPLPVLDVKLIETHPILHNFLRSDHTPFWWEDFPAIFMMDTGLYVSNKSMKVKGHRSSDYSLNQVPRLYVL